MNDIKDKSIESMEKSIESLHVELKKVRTGRAQASMLDSVMVDYYGTATALSQVATVSCPDAKSFQITPWEVSVLKDIEAGIIKSNIGMSPQNDGKSVRLKLPELTEERRKDMVKKIKKTIEDAKISIRMARRNANESLKALLKAKEISEDDQKRSLDEIQKSTDEFITKVDSIGTEKEKELMTI